MSNREIFIDKLRQLTKEEMLERYVALLNTEKLTDHVADLEAKLAEKEHSIEMLNQHLTDKALEIEKADRMFKDCEADRKFEQEKKNIALKRVSELTEQLAKKEKLLKKYVATSCPIIQDKIELLEKVKDIADREFNLDDGNLSLARVLSKINTIIKEIKGE